MGESILPQRQTPKLIVVTAFDRDEEGTLQAVYGPAEQQSEERAIRTAKVLAGKHSGAVACPVRPTPPLASMASRRPSLWVATCQT